MLLAIAAFVRSRPDETFRITRPLLGMVESETAQLEEMLDAYGARRNRRWFVLRELVAAAKSFAIAGYKLLHTEHSGARSHLLAVDDGFLRDTDRVIRYVSRAIRAILTRTIDYVGELGMTAPGQVLDGAIFREDQPRGALAADRPGRHVRSAREAAVHLATSFLELASEAEFLHLADVPEATPLTERVPAHVSEELLRQLEYRFHNMRSRYDTHISDTDVEQLDQDLPVLRAYISVILHLLEIATLFVHFYERHLAKSSANAPLDYVCPVDPRELLDAVFDYAVSHASRCLNTARSVCHRMLQRYAEIGEVDVPVPMYRGFHVRPSTLIAKIVLHYGSEVQMTLLDESYDASRPLGLFRANERLNAVKRRHIADTIADMPVRTTATDGDVLAEVHRIVLQMAERNRIVVYEHPLPLRDLKPHKGELLEQYIVDQITRLLALGKIDIETDITVTFRGDQRVLNDIRCLAENGYGEDRFGNNIPLPPQLSYLRR